MAQLNSMKQIRVKNIGFRVELMEWSNKMDLIAIANDKGEIIIQRLNWQKIHVFPPAGEGTKVRALSWQPGEAIIAAGYSNGKVALLDVEKEEEIYTFNCENDIKTLNWTKTNILVEHKKKEFDSSSTPRDEDYLSTLPNLNSLSSTSRKTDFCSTKSFAKGSPNFLVISLTSGEILLSVFGLLPCGTINILEYVEDHENYEIYDVRMSSTFKEIFVFIRNKDLLQMLIFENNILSKYAPPLLNLAIKHGNILDTLNYINETIQCIIEAWETVLLEMDNKLTKYANSQPEGSISADFLELLMLGYPSEALEKFLVRDLTEKGLKKLGNSIELSYSTIQKLVIKPLHNAASNLFYYLNGIKGLSRNAYCYSSLIEAKAGEKAVTSAGSFLIKIFELQQTIAQSVTDYKTFWCWLYMAIIRLMDESVPDEVSSVSQQDITYLAEFLNNFDDCIFEKEDGSIGKRKFNLERVGQYLEDCDLQNPSKQHEWNNLLDENVCFRDSGLIFPHHRNFSLIQEFNQLKKNITEVFGRPNIKISENFQLKSIVKCAKTTPDISVYTSYIANISKGTDMMVATTSLNELIYIESSSKALIKASRLEFSKGHFTQPKFQSLCNEISLRHLQFYNESTLSLLLQGSHDGHMNNYFVQLNMLDWQGKCSVHQIAREIDLIKAAAVNNFFEFIDVSSLKPIDGDTCLKIAVSGSRKVASILSDNCRKIRLYEMELDDDEEEMDTSQNATLDNSKDSVNDMIEV